MTGMSEIEIVPVAKAEEETESRSRKSGKKAKIKEKKLNVRELLDEAEDLDFDSPGSDDDSIE